MNWDDLRFLLAVRKAGSLGAAARLLKVEASTVSRRIGSLETALGVQLAARTPEGLVLNEAGLNAADLAETMDRGIADLASRIGGEDRRPEGIVRLSTTESTAVFLMRGLVPLRAEYPKIQVDLVISSSSADLLRREADIALRMYRETNPALVIRKIGAIGWSVFASNEYLARTGVPPAQHISAWLFGQAIVGYKDPVSRAPGPVWLAEHSSSDRIVMTCDSLTAGLNAVRAGLGVSVLPCFLAAEQPTLVRLTPAVVASSDAFVVLPPDHRETVRVKLVADALAALFDRERALLEGSAVATNP
jgi:DNA-binding transcriptional LysR family regulator